MFRFCESEVVSKIEQVETFVNGDLLIRTNSVSFNKAHMILTKERCRFTVTGITTLHFDSEFKITKAEEFYDSEQVRKFLDDCDLEKFQDPKSDENTPGSQEERDYAAQDKSNVKEEKTEL